MELFGIKIADFLDTAKLIDSLDVIISIDTAVLHLAGAMDKMTYGLLPANADSRFEMGHIWYPSIRLLRQEGSWAKLFEEITICL